MKRVTIIGSPYNSPAVKSGKTASWGIVLNDEAPSSNVTVTITGTKTTNNGPFTFTTGNWQTPQLVTITAVEDGFDFGRQIDELVVTATGGGYSYTGKIKQMVTDDACDFRLLQARPLIRSRHIELGVSLDTIRTELIAEISNGLGLPTTSVPNAETVGVTGWIQNNKVNLSTLNNRGTVTYHNWIQTDRLGHSWNSYSYHIPSTLGSSESICFVHSGHGSEFYHQEMIQTLLDDGIDVYYQVMPVCLANNTTNPGIGIGVGGHNDIRTTGLDDGIVNPMPLFLFDKIKAVNWLKANFNYTKRGFTGCSGGGWTTLFIGAIEPWFNTLIALRGFTNHTGNFSSTYLDLEQGPGVAFGTYQWFLGFTSQQLLDMYFQTAPIADMILLCGNGRTFHDYRNLYDGCCHQGNDIALIYPVLKKYCSYNFIQDDDSNYSLHGFNFPDRDLVLQAMISI